jgi:hypothetical protein
MNNALRVVEGLAGLGFSLANMGNIYNYYQSKVNPIPIPQTTPIWIPGIPTPNPALTNTINSTIHTNNSAQANIILYILLLVVGIALFIDAIKPLLKEFYPRR